MDKEKQIEEMATIMCGNDCEECARESAEFYRQTIEEARNNICLIKNCAKALYKANYRKINENEIIISKEEYKRLKNLEKFHIDNALLVEIVNAERKETAEKILNDIYRYNGSLFGTCFHKGHYVSDVRDLVKDIAEEYGVDLGEAK